MSTVRRCSCQAARTLRRRGLRDCLSLVARLRFSVRCCQGQTERYPVVDPSAVIKQPLGRPSCSQQPRRSPDLSGCTAGRCRTAPRAPPGQARRCARRSDRAASSQHGESFPPKDAPTCGSPQHAAPREGSRSARALPRSRRPRRSAAAEFSPRSHRRRTAQAAPSTHGGRARAQSDAGVART